MSLIIKTCLLLSLVVNCADTESFFDHLVQSHGPHSYYLVIAVHSPHYSGKVIIENHLLFLFLHRTRGIDRTSYESFATDLLVSNSPLRTKVANLERWGFRKLSKVPTVNNVAAKGKEEFIKHYFGGVQGRVLKAGVRDEEKNAIIEKLFQWQIATSHDDESGRLMYTRFDQQ